MSVDSKPPKNLLLVCYGGGHVNMLVPVIQELLEQGDYQITVLGLTTAGSVLSRNGISYIGFRDLVTPDNKELVEQVGTRLSRGMDRSQSVAHEETIAYLGLSYLDLENQLGPDAARQIYDRKKRQAFLPLDTMRYLFDLYQPDLLVSTNSPRAERAAFMVARERGIPAVCIVGLFAFHEIEWIGETGYASKICVLSDFVKQIFLDAGRGDDEVVVTGNPAFDRLARPELATMAFDLRNLNNWGSKKVVMWASQPEPEIHPFTGKSGDPSLPRVIESELLRVVATHSDWELVIRYHPGENIPEQRWPKNVTISTEDQDLAVLLKAVDTVVTMTSTVGVEAVLLGKPLIAVNLSIFRPDAPFENMGIARGVDSLEEIEPALQEVLNGRWKPREKMPVPGQAKKNILRLIMALLGNEA